METTITNMDSIVTWHFLQQQNPRDHEYQTTINPAIVLSMFTLSFIFVIVLVIVSESESVHVFITCLYMYYR